MPGRRPVRDSIRRSPERRGLGFTVTGVDPPSGHGALDPRRPLGVRTRHRRARARGRVRVHDRQAVVHGRAARRRGRRGGRVPRSHRPVRGAFRQRAPDGKSRPKPGSKRGDVLAERDGVERRSRHPRHPGRHRGRHRPRHVHANVVVVHPGDKLADGARETRVGGRGVREQVADVARFRSVRLTTRTTRPSEHLPQGPAPQGGRVS
mmetsp:Transcript_13338/g.52195  ORF Transcript_13338/g.52195 Transcript_13338/m.52195 type:complete len:207 (-) Transcript_13338:505-1125(-)